MLNHSVQKSFVTGLTVLAIFGAAPQTFAQPKTASKSESKSKAKVDCSGIADELRAMEKAQESISESLISNHDVFANLLTDYSSALEISAGMGKPVTKDAVTKMGESAKSFRERGKNAEKLNKKLTVASNDVIARAISCLKQ